MAEITMSVEEYFQMIRDLPDLHSKYVGPKRTIVDKTGILKPKRKGKKDPKMSRALQMANEMGRKKSGGFKKGWSQGKIMSKAHQLRRKM